MIEDVGMIIAGIGTRHEVITAEYLDGMYRDLHDEMYHNFSDYSGDRVTNYLRTFVKKLCRHLQSQELPTITTAMVRVDAFLSPVTVRLCLSTDQDVVFKMLGRSSPTPWYGLVYPDINQYRRSIYGMDNLAPAIREDLGYRECFYCHYSNDRGMYCGLGMEMYTGKCTKKRGSYD